jgi:hypothetical protein
MGLVQDAPAVVHNVMTLVLAVVRLIVHTPVVKPVKAGL